MTADPDSIRKEFEDARQKGRDNTPVNNAMALVRDTVQGIRDAGFDATVEFFVPGRVNAALPATAYAVGVVTLEGLEIDFALAPHATYARHTQIHLSVGGVRLGETWAEADYIRPALFDVKARMENAAQYNVMPQVVKPPRKPKLNT